MPFPPINLHQRLSSPGKELFRKKKPSAAIPPQSLEKDPDKAKFPSCWTSAHLKQLGRKAQPRIGLQTHRGAGDVGLECKTSWLSLPKPLGNSCDSMPVSSSVESATRKSSNHSSRSSLAKDEAEEEIRFSLSLTPEAILVLQKRNLEKQLLARQQKCALACASSDLRHRRVYPGKRAQGSKGHLPVAKLDTSDDIRTIVKISLLNDQYKYDDVEYEEEDYDVDETVVRKCKEWLEGVESAAAFGKVDKLSTLPHLNGC
ncbi:proline-rich protein 18 [Amia ocellicauda]|uniref:proline-rich protein 18 n=1 Tax=Amia ocellicauda TaxID=2972642 RepID=UPI0034642D89|nr:PRR18 protein [Amia calva]